MFWPHSAPLPQGEFSTAIPNHIFLGVSLVLQYLYHLLERSRSAVGLEQKQCAGHMQRLCHRVSLVLQYPYPIIFSSG
jgi:hypothetical protein